MQGVAIALVLVERLGAVTLAEIGANQDALRAFPERFARNGRQPCLDRMREPAGPGQALAKYLEGMEAQLAESLALDQDPIEIPIEKKVTGFIERRQGTGVHVGRRIQDAVDQIGRLTKVDDHVRMEVEVLGRGLDERGPRSAEPPERRTKVRERAHLRRVRPETTRDEQARQGPVVQCEECQQSLGAQREVKRSLT